MSDLIPPIVPNIEAGIAAIAMWGTALGMFFLSNWKLTQAGRSFLGVTVAFAALLTMNTIHLLVKDYEGIQIVRMFVYGFLALAAARVGWVVWRGILFNSPPPEGYEIVFHADDK